MTEEIYIKHQVKCIMIERKMIFNQSNFDKVKQENLQDLKKAYKKEYTKTGRKRK